MTMRIFTAALATETNTFSPIVIDRKGFEDSLYAPPGQHPDTPTLCTAPITVATEVIRIGRRRTRADSAMACATLAPSSRNWLANSTIRMPFFAANPTSMTMPIWLNRLRVLPVTARPISAPSTPSGTVSMITSGWMKLSNCAASTR